MRLNTCRSKGKRIDWIPSNSDLILLIDGLNSSSSLYRWLDNCWLAILYPVLCCTSLPQSLSSLFYLTYIVVNILLCSLSFLTFLVIIIAFLSRFCEKQYEKIMPEVLYHILLMIMFLLMRQYIYSQKQTLKQQTTTFRKHWWNHYNHQFHCGTTNAVLLFVFYVKL